MIQIKKTKELVTEIRAWGTWSYDIECLEWERTYIKKMQKFKIENKIVSGLRRYILKYSSWKDIRLNIEKNQVVPWVTRFVKIIDLLEVDDFFSRHACVCSIKELQKEICFPLCGE